MPTEQRIAAVNDVVKLDAETLHTFRKGERPSELDKKRRLTFR